MSLSTCSPRQIQTKPAKARQAQSRTEKVLIEKILKQGAQTSAQTAAQSAAALAVTQARLTDAEVAAWRQDLEQRLDKIQAHPEQNLGFVEEELARAAQEPLRLLAERAAQAKANATPCQCPDCQTELKRQQVLGRSIDSRFGRLKIYRKYGWCESCESWHFPADLVLGLHKNSPASPYLQETTALLNTKMPSAQAVAVAARFGLDLSRCFIHREAHRQGLAAQEVRQVSLAQLDTWEGRQKLAAAQNDGPAVEPFTLVIEIDASHLRRMGVW